MTHGVPVSDRIELGGEKLDCLLGHVKKVSCCGSASINAFWIRMHGPGLFIKILSPIWFSWADVVFIVIAGQLTGSRWV